MNTFLIISTNKAKREEYITQLLQEWHVDILDTNILETEGSIGIEEIRNFQKQLALKPFKGQDKAAIIDNAQTLTREAQNALLKTLEEPPAHTFLILSAENDDNFLATVISRTSVKY